MQSFQQCHGSNALTGLLCEEEPLPQQKKTGLLCEELPLPQQKGPLLSEEPLLQKKGLLLEEPQKRHQLSGPLLDEESTDMGSASEAETTCSSSTDFDEVFTGRFSSLRGSSRHVRHSIRSSFRQKDSHAHKWGSLLETIISTPVGTSEHSPLLFTCPPATANSTCTSDIGDASRVAASTSEEPRTNSVQAPPGLPSPVRTRKQRASQNVLATPAPSWEKRGARATQALLATPSPSLGETVATPSYVSWLPVSPTKQARMAFMEKARQDGAPLKISASFTEESLSTQEFQAGAPAKLGPLLEEPCKDSLTLVSKRVQGGIPAKKRVTPWLFTDLSFPIQEIPR